VNGLAFLICALVLLFFVGGCAEAESGPKLTGRLLIDGQPCQPVSVNDFDLKFLTVEGTGTGKRNYMAEVQPDGTFTVVGSIGKGIPVGRYKVIIYGRVRDGNGKPTNRYNEIYSDKATPFEIEIIKTTRELTIDLERKTIEVS
jgi:hypothetical protein